jgi:hypothetical protein
MKTGKTSAATLGLVGGIALGAWIGSEMTLLSGRDVATPAPSMEQVVDQPSPVPAAKRPRVSRVARAASVERSTAASAPKLVMTIPVSAPELHQRMKPVLARGTKLPLAAEGFTSAEQFATLAHAARNTQVPFILLKHRVLTEGQSLEDAIHASKPDVDARLEANRARTAAKADIQALASNVTTLNN